MQKTKFDHALMEAALAYLETNRDRQPRLDETAAHIGLSPAHFQRMFSAWVGVSPKRYLQHLTLGDAKRLLAERMTCLDTAHGTGLSGTSRLHDLFLRWEAMTPGEFAAGGHGLTIRWGWFPSPYGPMLAMATERGLSGLAFEGDQDRETTFEDMASRWPKARYVEDRAALAPMVDAVLKGAGEVRLAPMGGPFQIKVWEALMAIPEGAVTTYSEIARAIGHETAVRAVGTAVGRNPISWLIPCHRAMRKDGGLGGYHWGLGVKRRLLAVEGARREARTGTPEPHPIPAWDAPTRGQPASVAAVTSLRDRPL